MKQTRVEEKISRGEIAKMILGAVGVMGAVGAVCFLPGLVHLVPASYRKRYSYDAVRKTAHRLDQKGHLVLRDTSKGWQVKLTQKGYQEFLAYEFGQKGIPVPKRWNGKWHLLIFDIPEKRKYIRDKIRNFLRGLGFVRLQDSVWIHPHECKEVLEILRTRYNIRVEALYLRADWLDNDRWLKKEFHLPTR